MAPNTFNSNTEALYSRTTNTNKVFEGVTHFPDSRVTMASDEKT